MEDNQNNATKKESFVLYSAQKELIDILSDEEAGQLFKGIFKYANGEIPKLKGAVHMAFISIRQQLDRNAEKYEAKKEKLRLNGLKGGRPKKNNITNKPNGFSENQMVNSESKKSLYVNVNDNVYVNDNVNKLNNKNNIIDVSEKTKFKKPTIEEIKNYCIERKNNIDPQYFFDYYEGCNWMRGKTKIKDWQACIRTWEQNEKKYSNNQNINKKEIDGWNL